MQTKTNNSEKLTVKHFLGVVGFIFGVYMFGLGLCHLIVALNG